ncbi:MAG: MarR family winged helix-turn-helix transcriptional regulator [Hydrogenophaga sp.]|jgi:DNA-binding MarR family transcriptional regulator|nr:MarR family transcriptional regulator [Hydrogenophaga sp.]
MTDSTVANNLRRPRGARRTDASAPSASAAEAPPTDIDTRYLESLLGYNARRAALTIIGVFLKRMAPYGLRPVDFSVLTLVAHNPGITSRQICATLDILPPNLVGMIKELQKRELIERRPHPTDRRAQGLHLTPGGTRLQRQAQATASALEQDAAHDLTQAEYRTLIRLLKKVYNG